MLFKPLVALTSLMGLAAAYPGLLQGVAPANFERAVHALRGERLVDGIEKRQASTLTRGSQTASTAPCFNVYNAPSPTAYPNGPGPDGELGFGYNPPGSNDVRSPCPALNTLANHGYLPRDGRGINGSLAIWAFQTAWGIDQSVISVALTNALATCSFSQSDGIDDNSPELCEEFDLDSLNVPHMFEHDHSLSRQDYEETTFLQPQNNHVFNGTIFNQSLAVLGDSCYMTIQQAQEVRLTRESQQFALDKPGWFTLAPGTQLTEIGFIFSVMSDENQPGPNGMIGPNNQVAPSASVRVDWWQYWFMYESFPTVLGWSVPSPLVEGSFVKSISSLVQHASITSTPSPFNTYMLTPPSGSTVTLSGTIINPSLNNMYTEDYYNQKKKRTVAAEIAEATPAPTTTMSVRL